MPELLVTSGWFNNITVQNNSVQKALRGIVMVANPNGANGSGTLITQNDLNTSGANSIRLNPISVQGINGVTISNNNIGNISDANAELLRRHLAWFRAPTTPTSPVM